MALTRARLFGLTIESEFPLPGLVPADPAAAADVRVAVGPIEGEADLVIPGAGRFAVRGGTQVTVEPEPGAPERNVRLFLLGSAMGLVLHQRRLLPLHANAVDVGGAAVAVAGPSGAGKSTLAAWLHRQGRPLVGDDVIVVRPGEQPPRVWPGIPRMRLWDDALGALGVGAEGLERSYIEEGYDKFDLPVPTAAIAAEGLPLAALYLLTDAADFAIRPVTGAAAVAAIFDHTYRGEYLAATDGAAAHWQGAVGLAGTVPVFALERPRDLSRLERLGRALLDHAARLPAARTSAAAR